jgi:hypothetical protein
MFRKSLVFAGAVCLGMIMSTSASAGNNKDRLVVTGLTDANGFTSTLNGNPAYPKSSRISMRRATASRSARLAGSEGAS